MKKRLYLLLLSLLFISGCKIPEVDSVWPPTEVIIDGQSYDWEQDTFITLMNKNIGLGVQNDDKYLYIMFALRNRMWAELMQRNGVYLWFDRTAEMYKDFGLRYIGRLHIVEVPRDGAEKRPAINDPEQKSDYYVSIDDYMMVRDRTANKSDRIIPDGSSGPAANFSVPNKFNPSYIYEFKIPLQKSDSRIYGIGAKPGQAIDFGLQWGGMDEATLMRIRQMREMGMDPSMVRIPPSREIWIKINLATRKESKDEG